MLCSICFVDGSFYPYPPGLFHWHWDNHTHIFQGEFSGTGAIIWLPQCQWSNPEGYGQIWQLTYLQQNTNHAHNFWDVFLVNCTNPPLTIIHAIKTNPSAYFMYFIVHTAPCIHVHSWTKVYRIFFQRAVTLRWRGKSTICQFTNGNTSYFYKFVKFHRRRRNGHGPVPLNNEQRFKFAMSTYTRPAHHCDQRWTCVLTALRDSHYGPNLQQFQLPTAFTQINSISRNSEILHFYTLHWRNKANRSPTVPLHQPSWVINCLNLKLNSKHI